MPRIEDWEVVNPFKALMNEVESMPRGSLRSHPGIDSALEGLRDAVLWAHRQVRIARREWIIEDAQRRIIEATEELESLAAGEGDDNDE